MNGLEWVFSAVLTLVFLITGVNKAFRYEQARKLLPWVKDVPRALVQVIGIAEIRGALGLILPVATGSMSGLHLLLLSRLDYSCAWQSDFTPGGMRQRKLL